MKKEQKDSQKRMMINMSDLPLESSLGMLAYGDIMFTAWRELKKKSGMRPLYEKK